MSVTPRQMMGFEPPADRKISISVRDLNALKLAAWRSRVAFDIIAKQSADIVARCEHAAGCPGIALETEPCAPDCRDREIRMSALVALNAARRFAPVNANSVQSQEQYFAPSREYYSEILATLAAAQCELEAFYAEGRSVEPSAATVLSTVVPAQLAPKKDSP